jgi:ATP-dependent Clp protease ATP-binding subunit ClpB
LSAAAFNVYDISSSGGKGNDRLHTRLLRAVKSGTVGAVERLLTLESVDVNGRHMLGWGALHVAAVNGRGDVARVLLKAGADPNLPEEYTNIYHTAREKRMHSLGE